MQSLPALAKNMGTFKQYRTLSLWDPLSVLLVDDDADSREALAEVLAQQGCRILEAANGRQALDLLDGQGHDVKLILLDLQMPVMNGWEFLAALRLRALLPPPRIIVLSGQTPPPLAEVEAVLSKPVELTALLGLLHRLKCADPPMPEF